MNEQDLPKSDPASRIAELEIQLARVQRALDARKVEVGQLRMIEAAAMRWEHGSLRRPVADWSERWSQAKRRVVLFATFDTSGSLFRWAEAINLHTDWAARHVSVRPHPFEYPTDLVYGAPGRIDDRIHTLLDQADVIQLKDEAGFLAGRNRSPQDLLTRHEKPIVHMQYGGIARRLQDEPEYRKHVLNHDAVIALTPDLCFPWLEDKGVFIPHAFNDMAHEYSWQDSRIVGHSPSTRERKATKEFEEAVAKIDGIEVEIIEGVSNAECIRRKAKVGLFFDQAGTDSLADGREIGWYGNSGLEAALLGIPTLAHVSNAAITGAARGHNPIPDWFPIVRTGMSAEGIEKAIRHVLDMDQGDRQELSELTRKWVESFHGYRAIGPQLASLYEGLLK